VLWGWRDGGGLKQQCSDRFGEMVACCSFHSGTEGSGRVCSRRGTHGVVGDGVLRVDCAALDAELLSELGKRGTVRSCLGAFAGVCAPFARARVRDGDVRASDVARGERT